MGALAQQEWPVFLWPLALAYVFPDGSLPSARSRPVAALAALSGAGVVGRLFLAPSSTVPTAAPRAHCPSRSTRSAGCRRPRRAPAGAVARLRRGAPAAVAPAMPCGGSSLDPVSVVDGTGRFQGATGRVTRSREVRGGLDVVARVRLRRG